MVSLLPSATDTIVALGKEHCLVGRSHEVRVPSLGPGIVCIYGVLFEI